MNTVPHEGSRILDELYSNHNGNANLAGGAPFNVNQSDISYVNSEEGQHENEGQFINSGHQNIQSQLLNQSGR